MLISELISKLQKIRKDFGDWPIEIHCDHDKQTISAALWQDSDSAAYINAVTMGDKKDADK
jgi:hypothetical protein